MMSLNCLMVLILYQVFKIISNTLLQTSLSNTFLQTTKTMKLFYSTMKLINKKKNGEKIASLEVVEVVLVQCNLVDNQYERKSEVLYTFAPNKWYTYLLYFEQSNLVFLKTYKTEFDEVIITITDQNRRPLQIEDKLNLVLLIHKCG